MSGSGLVPWWVVGSDAPSASAVKVEESVSGDAVEADTEPGIPEPEVDPWLGY